MPQTIAYELARENVKQVAAEAINDLAAGVRELAPGTAAHGAMHFMGCGFLAGAQFQHDV